MKRILTLTLLLLSIATAGRANGPFTGSIVEFGGRFGIGAILPVGEMEVDYTPAFCGGFEINYTYMANQFFGFSTGLAYVRLNSSISGSGIQSDYSGQMFVELPTLGMSGVWADVHCIGITGNVKEEYQVSFIEIPLLLAINNGNWYYNLGFKLGIPLKMNADYELGESRFFIDYVHTTGTDLSDNPMPVDEVDPGKKGSYNPYANRSKSVFVNWSMEIGYSIDLTNNSAISIGAYLDYGLNDANLGNGEDAQLLKLNGSTVENYNGAVNSNMMSSMRYYKAGIRLLYDLGFGSRAGGRSGKKSKSLL